MNTKKKILLVDDSRTSLFMEQMILKRHSYDLILASDGAEVDKAEAEHDLILMDVVMPMNGFEASGSWGAPRRPGPSRHHGHYRGEGPNVEAGFESGCNDYLTKPIDPVRSWPSPQPPRQ
jgi:CheY-like chemotaxis protein